MIINNITHKVFLAPMAGVADSAYRRICRAHGAQATVSEMISAKAVCYGDKKTRALSCLHPDERPAGIQIFGSDALFMAQAAERLMAENPDFIDINMGCPVKKIFSSGDGSALMREPAKCREIISAVVSAVDVPVTVKLRAGVDQNNINAVEIAQIAEQSGAAAVFVHGRTTAQMYSGRADRAVIKAVKQSVSIPVIANGDIVDAASALEMLAYTQCDAIMIGRAALGNPWVFGEVTAALQNKPYQPPSNEQIVDTIKRHIDLIMENKGAHGIIEMRRHLGWYVKNRPNSAAARREINHITTKEQALDIIVNLFLISN